MDGSVHPLVAIVGPTGSGKSELALQIAEQFGGEIVNCDSLQIYRYFDVGTAKLTDAERRGVPHHLLDILNPDELFTAGAYARRARETLEDIRSRGRLPIVAGGTGFYLRALVDGLFEGPSRDDALRERLLGREALRPGALHRILTRLDRQAAEKIHPHDVPKVTRALEVCLLTRRPVTELFQAGRASLQGYRVLKLGLLPDREALYDRLNERCERMLQSGLVEEVRGILGMGYPPSCKPFESHGYKQVIQMLQGELSPRDALFYAQRNTRNYAKRQITWFRREPALYWLRGFVDTPGLAQEGLAAVDQFLQKKN